MKKIIYTFTLLLILVFLGTMTSAEQVSRETANSEAIADQVAGVLADASAHEKVKAVVYDFGVSSPDAKEKLSDDELKDVSALYTEEFTASLLRRIKDSGKRDSISVIDRGSLNDILRQKKLSATDVSERAEIEIARIAGLDIVITGKVYITGNAPMITAKVVRVKDGEILSLVKEDRQKKPIVLNAPVNIIDQSEKVKIGDWKTLPVSLSSDGTLIVTVNVVHGNPIEVYLIPRSEMEDFKKHKEVKNVPGFVPARTKNYQHSADVNSGNYYLILRDRSSGIFSKRSNEIKVNVQLQPKEKSD